MRVTWIFKKLSGRLRELHIIDLQKLWTACFLKSLGSSILNTVGLSLSQKFIDYELSTLKYTHFYNKLREPILRLHLSFDSTKVPDNYFDFIDELQMNDENASNNRDYYKFLNSLSFRLSNPESLPTYPILDRLETITRKSFAFADSMLFGEI